MFGYYLFFGGILYVVITIVCIRHKSKVAELGIEKDGKIVEWIPYYSRVFMDELHGARMASGLSFVDFCDDVGLSYWDWFLLECGYKVPPKILLGLFVNAGIVEVEKEGYFLRKDCELIKWCMEASLRCILNQVGESDKSIHITPHMTKPLVCIGDPSFDEYIFKGQPMLYFYTSISYEVDEVIVESIEKE
jgi:hypothetical protein